jgi:alanyl-tRNA synthetase
LQEENALLKKSIEKFESMQLSAQRDILKTKVQVVNDINFIGEVVEAANADSLKKLAFDLKGQFDQSAVVLVSNIAGKASVVVAFDDNLVKARNLDAGALIKQTIAPIIKGGGGGQKTLATAGGQDVSALPQVITAVKQQL